MPLTGDVIRSQKWSARVRWRNTPARQASVQTCETIPLLTNTMAHDGACASRHGSRLVGQRRGPMDPALATNSNAFGTPVVFQDGLGERRRTTDPSGAETLERL